ncbi:MAG TPA: DJ-1/PfpI family protein [Polyangiaceae bacterium]|nr:DJ-1/PfpI family protein [Polyangiaceae bacterium]
MTQPHATFQPPGARAPLELGMILYPEFTLLDLAGPQSVLGLHGRTHLIAASRAPVRSDGGDVCLQPTATFDDAPDRFDVLFVPGGFATNKAMEDPALLRFLADRGPRSAWVTSVCSGSLLLAAAGLLDGYRAATHWLAREALAAFGVEVSTERVATDRNRVTGGGVTAGIDFGLVLLAKMRGETIAKVTQLAIEYDPHPPFRAGTPEVAGPELAAMARAMAEGALRVDDEAVRRAQRAAGVARRGPRP